MPKGDVRGLCRALARDVTALRAQPARRPVEAHDRRGGALQVGEGHGLLLPEQPRRGNRIATVRSGGLVVSLQSSLGCQDVPLVQELRDQVLERVCGVFPPPRSPPPRSPPRRARLRLLCSRLVGKADAAAPMLATSAGVPREW
jgi:hypothetical protein